jgi:hypothetical protein
VGDSSDAVQKHDGHLIALLGFVHFRIGFDAQAHVRYELIDGVSKGLMTEALSEVS